MTSYDAATFVDTIANAIDVDASTISVCLSILTDHVKCCTDYVVCVVDVAVQVVSVTVIPGVAGAADTYEIVVRFSTAGWCITVCDLCCVCVSHTLHVCIITADAQKFVDLINSRMCSVNVLLD